MYYFLTRLAPQRPSADWKWYVSPFLLLSMDYMQGPESRAGAAALIRAFYRMIYDLNALGVPM